MNLHELIDRFGSQSPSTKTLEFLTFGAVIIAVLLFVFHLGVTKGDSWAESKYLKQRDENQIRATKAEAEQQRLAGVNDLLKKQNEDLAAERDKADKRLIAQNAERDRQREAELKQTVAAIDAQSTAPAVICGTCQAARDAGRPLSREFCGQCWEQP